MPICPGLVPPGWIEAQGLIAFPDQPPLQETLWLLLPEGRVLGSATARHLIRILRQRVEKAEEVRIQATSAGLGRADGSLQDAAGRG